METPSASQKNDCAPSRPIIRLYYKGKREKGKGKSALTQDFASGIFELHYFLPFHFCALVDSVFTLDPRFREDDEKCVLSDIPKKLAGLNPKQVDQEICRVGIIAELDAVNLYEQMAAHAKSSKLKAMLMDIAKEEKTHVGEFQALLLQTDTEQADELVHGKEEVEEMS